jgi:competence CoiA-like predicted nuclease
LGGNPYQHKYEQIYQLTDFQWSFIQASEKSGLCLFSYSPDDQHFHFLTHITSISSRKVTAVYSNRSLLKTSFPIYFPINEHTQYFDENWIKCKRNWIQQKLIYGEGFKDPFFLTMYECLLHPLLLPPIIGFPVSFMGVCKTHPASWQFYIWYDSLRHLNVGDKIHYNHIQKGIDRRVALHHIQFRNPPFVPQTYRKRMIYHYLQVLVKNSYLKEIRKGIFILNRTITFPNNMEEAIVVENEFLNQSRN